MEVAGQAEEHPLPRPKEVPVFGFALFLPECHCLPFLLPNLGAGRFLRQLEHFLEGHSLLLGDTLTFPILGRDACFAGQAGGR